MSKFKFGDKVRFIKNGDVGRYMCHARHSGYLVPFVFTGTDDEWHAAAVYIREEVDALDLDMSTNDIRRAPKMSRPDECEIEFVSHEYTLSDNQLKLCGNVLAFRCGFIVKSLDEIRKVMETDLDLCIDIASCYAPDCDYRDGNMDTYDREQIMETLAQYFGAEGWYNNSTPDVDKYVILQTMRKAAETNPNWEINEGIYHHIETLRQNLENERALIEAALKH